jgi:hypothetical protein
VSPIAFWTTLLIIHLVIGFTLLGAITHQALIVLMSVRDRPGVFLTRAAIVWYAFLVGRLAVNVQA